MWASAGAKYSMLNHLQAATRLLIRISIAIFTAIVLLLIQSAFWSGAVSVWMRAIIVATALLAYFRPQYGLLTLVAVVPLGQVGSRTLDSSMRGAESLVLAFLAGALVRGSTLREFRTFAATWFETAALIFAFVVVASCAEQLWLLQIQRDFPLQFAQTTLTYMSRDYLAFFGSYGAIVRAMMLLEGLGLLLCAAQYVRSSPEFAHRLVAMLVIGGASTALLTVRDAIAEFMRPGEAEAGVLNFFAHHRWSGHIADVNAAGSYFVMTLFIALGMAARKDARRLPWVAAAIVLALTTLATGSRTAVAAAGVVGIIFLAWIARRRPSFVWRAAIAAVALLALAGSIYLITRTTGAAASQALSIRWAFLKTTAAMVRAYPTFGVGIGQYTAWASYFATPDLLALWKPDNAHNNFAQIAGELGLLGLIAFVVVLAGSLWPTDKDSVPDRRRGPLVMGVIAFILTWLGGHPLLVPEASFPFWIALGAAAALAARSGGRVMVNGLLIAALVALAATIPLRVQSRSPGIDLSRVSYGLSARHIMTSRARLFAPAGSAQIDIPLRARRVSDEEPVHIDLFVNDALTESITMTKREWQTARVVLPDNPSGRFHEIDLRLTSPDRADDVDAAPASVEVGTWKIVPKPQG